MRRSLTGWSAVGAVAVAVASAVGIAFGATSGDGNALDLAVLDGPPSLSAPVPDRVGGVAFADIHSPVDLGQRRLASSGGGELVFVAPSRVRDGEVCLLTVAASGSAASTCNGASAIADQGAIPLLRFRSDQGVQVTAIVPDDVSGARADDGTRGTVQNNVLSMSIGAGVDSIALISDGGRTSHLDVGLWRDPPQ